MARNLTRNTKLYVSNQSVLASCTSANTWELKVLDGYSYTQPTTSEDITISEAGSTPIRGQKTYNTAREPVDLSISTYIRPYDNNASLIDAPERILWASLAGRLATITNANGDHIDTTPGNGSAILQQATGSGMEIDFEESDSNELAKLTFWFHLENSTYRVDEVNMSTAELDFAIDGIATINWSGMGTGVAELSVADHAIVAAWVAGVGGTDDYRAVPATTSASFLRNKLSTMSLVNNNIAATPLDTATVTSADSTSITDIGSTFQTDAILSVGDYVRDTTTGETRVIQSIDSETTITIVGSWTTTPSVSDALSFYAASDNAGQSYTIAITVGSLTIENNMDFLTPEELGIVNQPLPGFAGARAVTGNVTAYLDTGAYGTAALLQDMLDQVNDVSNSFSFTLHIGGTSTALKRVELSLATAQLGVPTINVEDVIATEITFAGQGSADQIENQDEVTLTYHSN